MLFKEKEVVRLGQDDYQIVRFLGGGAVADVYLTTWLGQEPVDLIIKVLRDDYKKIPFQDDREKLFKAMRAEIDALNRLNPAEDTGWNKSSLIADKISRASQTQTKRKIISLFDNGMIGEFPYLIQELAPAEFKPFEVNDLHSEIKMLKVAHAIAQAIQVAHSNGIALKDFEPYTKGDRIRLRWHDDGFEIKIIDWNINGTDNNDFKTDLIYLGCHLYRFFIGEYLPFDNSSHLPPEKLDLYPAWNANLNEGTRLILQRLLSRISVETYSDINELVNAVSVWLDDLKEYSEHPTPVEHLLKQCKTAFDAKQFRRTLALAHLALDNIKDLSNRDVERFNAHVVAAREKIEDNYWPIIDKARLAYSMQKYDRAAQEYALKIRELPPQILLTKEACAEMLLAQAKDELSHRTPSQLSPVLDKKIDNAVQLLLSSRWNELTNIKGELPDINPIRLMSQWADFEIVLSLVKKSAIPTRHTTENIQEWLSYEDEYVTNFSNTLEKAWSLANDLSFLPWISGELDTLQLICEQHKDTKDRVSNLGNEIQSLEPSFSVLVRVDQLPEGRKSLKDGLNELFALEKHFVDGKLAERITELLHKSSQLAGYKDLGDQLWLLELRNDLLIQQEHLGSLKEKIERHRDASVRESEIIDLLKIHEYEQAGQRFDEFEKEYREFRSYSDIESMAQQVDDGRWRIAENWQKLKNAANLLQPFDNTFRNFEAAHEELIAASEQIPAQIQSAKALLEEFAIIALDYPLLYQEPTFDNIDECYKLALHLESAVGKIAEAWQDLNLAWDGDKVKWVLTDRENKWIGIVSDLLQTYEKMQSREESWRDALDDIISSAPHIENIDHEKLEKIQPKGVSWQDVPAIPMFKNWPNDLARLFFLIKYFISEKANNRISENFYGEWYSKLVECYLLFFEKIPFGLTEISSINNIVSQTIALDSTEFLQQFQAEWSVFSNSRTKLLLENLCARKIAHELLLNQTDELVPELNSFITSKWHNLYKNFLVDDAIQFKYYLEQTKFLGKNVDAVSELAPQLEKWNEYFTLLGLPSIELKEAIQQIKCNEETDKITAGVEKLEKDIQDSEKTIISLSNEAKQLIQGISIECHSFINQTAIYDKFVFIETHLNTLKEWGADLDNKPAPNDIDDGLFLIDSLNKKYLEIKNLQEQGNLDCIPGLADRYNAIGQKLLDRIEGFIQFVNDDIKLGILLIDTSVDLIKRIFGLLVPDELTEKVHSKLIGLAKELRSCLMDDLQRNSLPNIDLKSSQASLSKLALINDFLYEDNISTYDILDIVKRTDARIESMIDERIPPPSDILHSDAILFQEYLNEYQSFCESVLATQPKIQILLDKNEQYKLKLQKVIQLAKTARNYLTPEFSRLRYRILYPLLEIAEVMSDKEESLSQSRSLDVFSEFLDSWEMEVLRLADVPSIANMQSLVIDCWKKNPNLFSTLRQVRQFRQYFYKRKLVIKNSDWEQFDQLLANWTSWLLRGWLKYHWKYVLVAVSVAVIAFGSLIYILIHQVYPILNCVYLTILARHWNINGILGCIKR